MIRVRPPRWPDAWVPAHFLVKRSAGLLRNRRRLPAPRGLVLLLAGFGFDLIAWLLARWRADAVQGIGRKSVL